MTIWAKIFSTVGLIMLYGFLSSLILLSLGKGPSVIGMFLSLGLLGGIIAIWRSKPPKNFDDDILDKTRNDGI